jgi:hypothetical protein
MNTNVKKIWGCKVCRDAGKDENVYTGHMTRDLTGTVVCPTLLEQECRYCREKGHTPKFCPVLHDKEKRSAKAVRTDTFHRENVIRASMPKMLPNKRVASFAALVDDSDEEDDDDVVQLSANVTLRPGQESYAEMLKKEALPKKREEPVCVAIPKRTDPLNRAGDSILGVRSPRMAGKIWNWADCESSDDEDEERSYVREYCGF